MSTRTLPQAARHLLERTPIAGPVVFPDDDGWDAARQAWNLAVDQRPMAVVFPRNSEDVRAAVRAAADLGARVVVQGTGHSAAAYGSMEDSLLLRTTHLNGVSVSVDRRCRVEAGVLWGEVAPTAGRLGLAGLGGSSPDVGIVGYTLGGGIGWLSRRYGLASNSVRAVEIVTADGVRRLVDHDHMPQVFWALRGGGGGIGVVTSLEFDLYPVPTVTAGTLVWEARHARTLLDAWVEWTHEIDESITSIIRFLDLPDIDQVPQIFRGRKTMTLGIAGIGEPDEVDARLDPLRRVAPLVADTVRQMPAAGLSRLHGDPEGPTAGMAHHTLLDNLDDAALDALDGLAGVGSDSGLISVEVRHLGGALARPPKGAGALSHLSAPYVLNAVAAVTDHGSRPEPRAALTRIVDGMRTWSAGSYLNFVERPGELAFDEATYRRLAAVRAEVDPTGVFKVRSGLERAAGRS